MIYGIRGYGKMLYFFSEDRRWSNATRTFFENFSNVQTLWIPSLRAASVLLVAKQSPLAGENPVKTGDCFRKGSFAAPSQ
jgi:hypothetical protein